MNIRSYSRQLDSAATGRNIRGWRAKLNMTAKELGKLIGRSEAYVSRVECGERPIKPKMMRRIEAALSKANGGK